MNDDTLLVGAETTIKDFRAKVDKWFWVKDGLTHKFFYSFDKYMKVDWIFFLWNWLVFGCFFASSIGGSLLLSTIADNTDFLT